MNSKHSPAQSASETGITQLGHECRAESGPTSFLSAHFWDFIDYPHVDNIGVLFLYVIKEIVAKIEIINDWKQMWSSL